MSLIICEECGAKISDRAETCPHCGFPLKKNETIEKAREIEEIEVVKRKRKSGKISTVIIVIFLIILCLLFPPVLTLSAPVWIPAFLFLANWIDKKIPFKRILVGIILVLTIFIIFLFCVGYYQENSIDPNIKNMSEQDFKKVCVSLPYDDLLRNPENYTGKYVTFTGKILQVISDEEDPSIYLVSTSDEGFFWGNNVYVILPHDYVNGNFLKDDMVSFYGSFKGTHTYESVLKQNLKVPKVLAAYMELE